MILDSARRPPIPLAGPLAPAALEQAALPVEFGLEHGSPAVAPRRAAHLSVRGSGRGPTAPRRAAVPDRLAAEILERP